MKKIISLFLAICFLVPPLYATAAEGAIISVATVETVPGETITVDVLLTNNNGLGGMEFSISFDVTALILTAVDTTDAVAAFTVAPVDTANEKGRIGFSYANVSNVVGDGKIASLLFAVSDNTEGKYALSVDIPAGVAFYYDGQEMLDLSLTAEQGVIFVKGDVNGDMNGDGTVDIVDVLVALRAFLKGESFSKADMNGDGKFSLIDVLKVLKLTVV